MNKKPMATKQILNEQYKSPLSRQSNFLRSINVLSVFALKIIIISVVLATSFCGCSDVTKTSEKHNSEKNIQDNFKWSARGEYIAVDMKKLYPPFSTEVVKLVPEGQIVNKGEIICELAPKDRLEKQAIQEVASKIMDMSYDEINYRLKYINEIEQNKLDITKLNTQRCLLKLNQAKRLRDWQRIVELEAALKTYKLNKELLEKKLRAKTSMVKRGFSAKLEELRLEKDLYIAKLTLAYANSLLSYLLEHVDEELVITALHDYNNAKAAETTAEYLFRKNVDTVLVDFEKAKRSKQDERIKLRKLNSEIASLTIRANFSGTTLWGKAYDGTAWTKMYEGAQIWPGLHIVSLISGDERGIEFYIDQSEISYLNLDDQIVFLPDAYPELRIVGKVYFISPIALSLPNTGDGIICKFKVKAKIEKTSKMLKLGNSGTVLPFTEQEALDSNANSMYTVRKAKVNREVSSLGDIKPSEAANIVSPFRGKLKSIKEEGEEVQEGDIIASMKSDEEEQKLTDTILELQKKEEELALLEKKNELENEKLNKMSEVKLGSLKVSELEHSALLKRRDDDKISKLQKDLDLISDKISLSKEKLEHTKELYKKGLRSSLEILEIKLEIANHIKDKTVTTNELRLEQSGPTQTQIEISKLDVLQAKLEYEKACLEKDLAIYTNNIKYKQLEFDIQIKSELKMVSKRKVEDAQIKSPIAGVIVLPEVHKPGGKRGKAEVGDTVQEMIPFMQVAKMSSLEIYTKFSEMDSKFLKLGQEVSVSLEAHPGKDFRGWIKEVGVLATTDFEKRQDAVVEVIISLKSKKHSIDTIPPEFKPGATCEVKVKLYDIDEALVVPFDYCSSDASGSYVITNNGNKKRVQLILSDGLNGYIVKSGIEKGDKVIDLRGSL